MIRFSAVATVTALTASLALSAPASAETRTHGMRSADHAAVATRHRAHKRAAKHTAKHVAEWSERALPGDAPFAGVRHDRAGNSYDYYRSGIGSPIPPVLR